MSTYFKTFAVLGCLLFIRLAAYSQDFDLQTPLAVDTAVKIGRLDNGLTYYLRYNAKPEKRI